MAHTPKIIRPADAASAGAPAEHLAWQQSRLDHVAGPRGNVALVGFEPIDAEPGAPETIVEALGAAFRRTAGEHGAWVRSLEPGLTLDGEPLTEETFVEALRADGTSVLARGRVSADVFSLDGTDYEVRVYDADSPRLSDFRGIEVYPYDPGLVLTGRLVPYDESQAVPWGFTRSSDTGHTKQVPGRLAVTIAGEDYELLVFEDGGGLVLVFADATTGVESYAPGRFLKTALPGEDGVVAVDLNRVIVPPCGFSDFYSCPLPPPGNRIAAPVRAGEKRSVWAEGCGY